MRCLSQKYQNLEPASPSPTFTKTEWPAPQKSILDKYLPLMPHLRQTVLTSELGSKYAHLNQDALRVDWRVWRSQAEALRAEVQKAVPSLLVSIQDCLTAYIVTLINRCSDTAILVLTNAASVGRCHLQ